MTQVAYVGSVLVGGLLVSINVFPGLAKGDSHGDGPIMPFFSALQFVNGKDSLIDHCVIQHDVNLNLFVGVVEVSGLITY